MAKVCLKETGMGKEGRKKKKIAILHSFPGPVVSIARATEKAGNFFFRTAEGGVGE